MIDLEIHGTGGRNVQARDHLLEQTRQALVATDYYDQLTLVDTGSTVLTMDRIQAPPFARIYAPPSVLDNVIQDIRAKLQDLFATLEGVQVIRVNIREAVHEALQQEGVLRGDT